MIDAILFSSVSDTIDEASALSITAKFRDTKARADGTPTTVEWALREPACNRQIQSFTPLTPGTTVTLATTAAQNTCLHYNDSEQREVTILIDRGLATQFTATYRYTVNNIGAIC